MLRSCQTPRKMRMPSPNCSRLPDFDTVSLQKNVGNLDFKRAIRKFEEAAGDADIAVVYYAGHGIEIDSLGAVRDLQKRVCPLECGSACAPPAGRTKGTFHNWRRA